MEGHFQRKAPHLRGHQGLQPLDVQRQTDQVPLPLHFPKSSNAETPKSQPLFDPAVGRFREPFARRVGRPTGLRHQLLRHPHRRRCPLRISGLGRVLPLSAQRHVPVDPPGLQFRQVPFVAVVRIRQDRLRDFPYVACIASNCAIICP